MGYGPYSVATSFTVSAPAEKESEMTVEVKRRRDIPRWVGVAVVLIGLGAGGWFIYWQLSGYFGGKARIFTIPGVDPTAVRMAQTPQQPNWSQMDPIRPTDNNAWRVREGVKRSTAATPVL